MLKIGLTGNYYSGQNEVSEIFEKLSVKVFDADLILKYLINFSETHVEKIKDTLGDKVYQMGLLNMNKFRTNESWNDLIDLVEFDVVKSYERFRLTHKDEFYTIFKYSFLFERNLNKSMDKVICCYRPKYQRRSDLKRLTYLSESQIEYLLSNEMDELSKNKSSDYLINNYNTSGSAHTLIGLDSRVSDLHNIFSNKKPQEDYLGYKYSSGFWD